MRNRTFHQARIADMIFEGIVAGDGPYISCQINGGVALGVSSLRYFQPSSQGTHHAPPQLGWWVVKYSDEQRIFLPDFDQAAIRELSDEFGLPILVERGFDPFDQARREYFFTSPAWDALRLWVTRHPRLARQYAPYDSYLRGWYDRAIMQAGALPSWPPHASHR
jgi:hypothetical protein